jgi:hypothetical protein
MAIAGAYPFSRHAETPKPNGAWLLKPLLSRTALSTEGLQNHLVTQRFLITLARFEVTVGYLVL